jgi:hypothetical protein
LYIGLVPAFLFLSGLVIKSFFMSDKNFTLLHVGWMDKLVEKKYVNGHGKVGNMERESLDNVKFE